MNAQPTSPALEASPSRPTMRDVAALAGVALKTVSRVMNAEPTVNPEMAARVHAAAEKLGYRPNLVASSLRRGDGRTSMIGLLVEDASNPFSAALLRAAEDVATSRGVDVLIGSLDEDPGRERTVAQKLIDRNVDGLVIVPAGQDQSYLVNESRRGARVVFADREPHFYSADAVVSDSVGGARAATEHLLAAGHQRIGYLGDLLAISTAAQRYQGYGGSLREHGLAVDPQIVRHDLHTIEAAERASSELLALSTPPTALFTSQNLVTIGAIRTLRRLGLQHAIALVGFDDFLLADLLEPAVTVITQDVAEMGRRATELLFSRLDGEASAPRVHVIGTGMICRGSGEIPAAHGTVAP